MYPTVRDPQVVASRDNTPGRARWARVSRNVLMLGLTSLFTDVSSEMLTAVLPLYFTLELKMTMAQVGLIDGLYQASSALVRVVSGIVADFRGRYKEVALVGYGLGVVCRVGLLAAGFTWQTITGLLMLDRLGKGIRTAPRDAIITLSSDRKRLGEAFGVHRMLDTVGAFLGPIVAFAILAWAPRGYDAVFVVSLAFCVIGVAILWLFVEHKADRSVSEGPALRVRLVALLRLGRFRRVFGAGLLLSTLTASDALIYLRLQHGGAVPVSLFPLLFVGTSGVYLLLALPTGRLADAVGRHRLFLAGHVALAFLYAWLVASPAQSSLGVLACVALLGTYYAATDGVLAALASSALPADAVTTGLALVSTGTAVARLLAAAMFGALWSWFGDTRAFGVFLVALIGGVLAVGAALEIQRPWRSQLEEGG
jgi:MFS family permease